MDKRLVLKEIERKLEYHPGDAPWSCVDCYHNRPCLALEILLAAKKYLTKSKTSKKRTRIKDLTVSP